MFSVLTIGLEDANLHAKIHYNTAFLAMQGKKTANLAVS